MFVSGIAEKEPGVALEGICEERERSNRLPFQSTTTLGSEKKGSHFTLFARSFSLRKKTEREREREREETK